MKYRRRLDLVEAVQWDGSPETANAFVGERDVDWKYRGLSCTNIVILKGYSSMFIRVGHWIVKTESGMMYAVPSDVFERTFEPVC